ncbi:unnamed protein product, partial [Brassica oleracea var. botrytis]
MAGPVECVARRRVQSRLTDMVLKLQEELSNELDLQIKVAEKPSVWELLRVRFIRLPDIIIKLLVWYISRVWRYIRVSFDSWTNLEYKKEDLGQGGPWEKQNLENYFACTSWITSDYGMVRL